MKKILNKEFKKFLPVYLVILTLVILISSSYALLRNSQIGEKTYTMNVGTLEINFVDQNTNALSLSNMYPMTDEEGMSQSDVLEFTVSNDGNLKANYNVYIEETSTDPIMASVMKFAYCKKAPGETEYSEYSEPILLSSNKYIEIKGTLNSTETASYKVKMWLDESADSTYMNKTFKARVIVEALQYQKNGSELVLLSAANRANDGSSCLTTVTDTDDTVYISGSQECIDFNYVWYSGKMWRIVAIYPDGSMKLVTDTSVVSYLFSGALVGEDDYSSMYCDNGLDACWNTINSKNKVSNVKVLPLAIDIPEYEATEDSSTARIWLKSVFLNTLYSYPNIVNEDGKWSFPTDSDFSTTEIPTNPETLLSQLSVNQQAVNPESTSTIVTYDPVGLLSAYEYYMGSYNASVNEHNESNSYLNNGQEWWTITPTSSTDVLLVDKNGLNTDSMPNYAHGIRPSIYLKTGIAFNSGNGTINNPYTISGDKSAPTFNTTLLNTRQSGEFVRFDGDLYRIVQFEDSLTKLIKIDVLKDENEQVINRKRSEDETYGTDDDTYWEDYLNNTWYNSISTTYKNMINVKTIDVNWMNRWTASLRPNDRFVFTGYAFLPIYGELFSSQYYGRTADNYALTLMNRFTSAISYANACLPDWQDDDTLVYGTGAAKPTIYLNSNVVITSGTGLPNDPFTIASGT